MSCSLNNRGRDSTESARYRQTGDEKGRFFGVEPDMVIGGETVFGGFVPVIVGLVLAVAFLIAPFLPRKKRVRVYDLLRI